MCGVILGVHDKLLLLQRDRRLSSLQIPSFLLGGCVRTMALGDARVDAIDVIPGLPDGHKGTCRSRSLQDAQFVFKDELKRPAGSSGLSKQAQNAS